MGKNKFTISSVPLFSRKFAKQMITRKGEWIFTRIIMIYFLLMNGSVETFQKIINLFLKWQRIYIILFHQVHYQRPCTVIGAHTFVVALIVFIKEMYTSMIFLSTSHISTDYFGLKGLHYSKVQSLLGWSVFLLVCSLFLSILCAVINTAGKYLFIVPG